MSAHAGPGAEQRIVDDRDVSVAAFVETKAEYFAPVFERLQRGELPRWNMNIWGLLIPWFWAAYRGVWVMFWIALAVDVLGIVCLMQVVKFSALLEVAQADAANNVTLIARYSSWISNFGMAGIVILVGGRLWMGSSANRWYYAQYSRWRTNSDVSNGLDMRRVVTAAVIIAMVAPLTIYRASTQRLDERACLKQIRAGETVETLLAQYGQRCDVSELLRSFRRGPRP